MKLKTSNGIKILLLEILFPAVICFFITYLLDNKYLSSSPIYLMPLFFGVVLGFFDYKFYKRKIYFNQIIQVTLISIIVSFFSFFLGVFSYLILVYTIDFLFEILPVTLGKDTISRLSILLAVYLVSPLSLLLTLKGIYKYPKGKTTKVLIIVILIIFTLLGSIDYYINELMSLLMPLMLISIQVILYQKELMVLLRGRNIEP